MKLTVKDRIGLINLLPQKGNFDELIHAKHIEKKIEFTEDEMKVLKIRTENERVIWDRTGEEEINVTFTDEQAKVLKASVNKLSEAGELSFAMIDLVEQIMDL